MSLQDLHNNLMLNSTNDHIQEHTKEKYPKEISIVIQHEYYHLSVNRYDFNIGLSFNNKKSDLKISFDSILSFADPSANFGLNYQFNKTTKKKEKNKEKKNKT